MAGRSAEPPRRRSWLEVRWRQFRNAPRPVVRAVVSSLSVAVLLALVVLAYDVVWSRAGPLPGGDLRLLVGALYVLGVVVSGTVITWLVVPLPTGSGTRRTRTPWSAALGFFAALPIAYLVLIVAFQVVRPLLG
jgi:hypothetical protein